MIIFPPSGLGCDLEFEFDSFEFKIPLICMYNKNVQGVTLSGRSAVVGLLREK